MITRCRSPDECVCGSSSLLKAQTMPSLAAFACLAATAATLRPAAPLRTRSVAVQRTSNVVAQNGWLAAVDEASGATYYFNEQTGQSQWDPPTASSDRCAAQQVLWRLHPTSGVYSEYAVRNGEEQCLGSYDMVAENPLVSPAQCLLQVSAEGNAQLISLGERATGLRARIGAPWYGLKKGATHVLVDGEQIALDVYDKTAVFTCQQERADMGGFTEQDYTQHGGYPQHQQGGYYQEHGGYTL